MRKGQKDGAKLVVYARSEGKPGPLRTIRIDDRRTGSEWPDEKIEQRGVQRFMSLRDMQETLNWNLGGCEARYGIEWISPGIVAAYIYD